MEAFAAPGTYEDADGTERLIWTFEASDRRSWHGRFEIRTVIRGVDFRGPDFDALELCDRDAVPDAGFTLTRTGLSECLLSGDLPCTVEKADVRAPSTLHFQLDLRGANEILHLSMDASDNHTTTDGWFEDGFIPLEQAIAPQRLVCCATCLYSDYSPGGHGLTGMRCHRDAKEQYLAVRSKFDYFKVPVTEDVPEFYLCGEYTRRIPGTGYRG